VLNKTHLESMIISYSKRWS